jgi:hypothetical protein
MSVFLSHPTSLKQVLCSHQNRLWSIVCFCLSFGSNTQTRPQYASIQKYSNEDDVPVDFVLFYTTGLQCFSIYPKILLFLTYVSATLSTQNTQWNTAAWNHGPAALDLHARFFRSAAVSAQNGHPYQGWEGSGEIEMSLCSVCLKSSLFTENIRHLCRCFWSLWALHKRVTIYILKIWRNPGHVSAPRFVWQSIWVYSAQIKITPALSKCFCLYSVQNTLSNSLFLYKITVPRSHVSASLLFPLLYTTRPPHSVYIHKRYLGRAMSLRLYLLKIFNKWVLGMYKNGILAYHDPAALLVQNTMS